MKKGIIFIALIVGLLMTGCSAQSSAKGAEIDTEKFIVDTKEIIATAEEVYRTQREYTTEEKVDVDFYEDQYGSYEDTDIKLMVNYALLASMGAKRLDGVDDAFARDFEYVNMLIEDYENGAHLE
jgi:uncharacterized lipoprotein NlpE involved in copper resistance